MTNTMTNTMTKTMTNTMTKTTTNTMTNTLFSPFYVSIDPWRGGKQENAIKSKYGLRPLVQTK